MNNVSNYNVFDIKAGEGDVLNITPRMVNDLSTRALIVMRGASEDPDTYGCDVYYFVTAYKNDDVYFMKLLSGTSLFTYYSNGLDEPFIPD